MPKSLKEVLENSSKNKTRIGYSDGLSGYDTAVQQMGLLAGEVEEEEEDVLQQKSTITEAASSELGNYQFDSNDNTVDGDGMYNTHQTACVLIQPFLSFPYKDAADSKIRCLRTGVYETSNGEVYQGGLLTVPDTFDKANIDACAGSNSGDFIIGCSIGLGNGFLNSYVAKFYPNIEVRKFQELAKKGALYGEIFLPSGTNSNSGRVMVCRVIKESSGEKRSFSLFGNALMSLFYYDCFVPAPLLMINGYRDVYKVSDSFNNLITDAAFNQSATYSYAKATIETFGPSVIQNYIKTQGQLETVSGKVLWEQNATEQLQTLLGRFRFVVPPSAASTATSIIKEEDAPDLYKMTDPSIADGLTRSAAPVGQITNVASGSFYYPEIVRPYVAEHAWVKGFRVMWSMEVGNASPSLEELISSAERVKIETGYEDWISAGPSQFTKATLKVYLKYIYEQVHGLPQEDVLSEIDAATRGGMSAADAAPHVKWIHELFNEAGLDTLISSAIKVWSDDYYLRQAISAFEVMQFQGSCNLGFTMCMYLVNAGWHRMKGYARGAAKSSYSGIVNIRAASTNEAKCMAFIDNFDIKDTTNLKNVLKFWRNACAAGDYAFEGTYDMSAYGKKGTV